MSSRQRKLKIRASMMRSHDAQSAMRADYRSAQALRNANIHSHCPGKQIAEMRAELMLARPARLIKKV